MKKRPGGGNTEQEYKKLCLTFASRTEHSSLGELQVSRASVRVQLPQFLELGSPLVHVLAGGAGAEGAEGAEAAGAGAAALGAEDSQRVVRGARAAALGLPEQRRQRPPEPRGSRGPQRRPEGARERGRGLLPPVQGIGRAALHRHLQLRHVVGVLQGEIGHMALILCGSQKFMLCWD